MPTSTRLDKGKSMSSADPNVVIVTGENPFIRLSVKEGGAPIFSSNSCVVATPAANVSVILPF
jgi:hypothetical protein